MTRLKHLREQWDKMDNAFKAVQQAYYSGKAAEARNGWQACPEIEAALMACRKALETLESEIRAEDRRERVSTE